MYSTDKLKLSYQKGLTKIKDIYEMVQTCRVLQSRKKWKRKAMKRGAENRELRKTLNRKNEQIDRLKFGLGPEATSDDIFKAKEAANARRVKKVRNKPAITTDNYCGRS